MSVSVTNSIALRLLIILVLIHGSGCSFLGNGDGSPPKENSSTIQEPLNAKDFKVQPTTAQESLPYSYQPEVLSGVQFELSDQPDWLKIDSQSGRLFGIPSVSGTHPDIILKATRAEETLEIKGIQIEVLGDPLVSHSWHIKNTGQSSFALNGGTAGHDLNVMGAWALGYTGKGVRVWVSDSGAEISHEDLDANVITGASRNYITNSVAPYEGDPTPPTTATRNNPTGLGGDHGTGVSGIIAASGWNGKGGRGIAPNVKFAACNFIEGSQIEATLIDQLNPKDMDIANQSWGTDQGTQNPINPQYLRQMKYAVSQLRNAKGLIIVRAAGNDYFREVISRNPTRFRTGPVNFDANNVYPYSIVVAALGAKEVKSTYSSTGPAIWVSGLGGEYGTTDPAIVTTDRSSCDLGYSVSTTMRTLFNKGTDPGKLNSACNYLNTFNGTSSASPSVAAVVALMLEANPALTWRDVKHVLALTADPVHTDIADLRNPLDPPGYVVEPKWTTNAAGIKFHHWYGFGRVNAEKAVKMAKDFTPLGRLLETATGDAWKYSSGNLALAIPDNNANGITSTLAVTERWKIEAVQIGISITHSTIADIGIELVSPSGTRSVVIPMNNAATHTTQSGAIVRQRNYASAVFLTNAFYGESSSGTWTLRVMDGSGDTTGTLTNWKINVFGRE